MLIIENQWEKLTFHLNGRQLSDADLRAIDAINVIWPDGIAQRLKVNAYVRNASYSDHGHVYQVSSLDIMVSLDHHGHEIKLPISRFKDMVTMFGTEPVVKAKARRRRTARVADDEGESI